MFLVEKLLKFFEYRVCSISRGQVHHRQLGRTNKTTPEITKKSTQRMNSQSVSMLWASSIFILFSSLISTANGHLEIPHVNYFRKTEEWVTDNPFNVAFIIATTVCIMNVGALACFMCIRKRKRRNRYQKVSFDSSDESDIDLERLTPIKFNSDEDGI